MLTKRKRKSPEERGFLPIETVAANLRALAVQLVQDNKGRLAKATLNVWYEDPEPLEIVAPSAAHQGGGAFGITPLGAAIVEAMPDRAKQQRIQKRFKQSGICPESALFTAAQVEAYYHKHNLKIKARGYGVK